MSRRRLAQHLEHVYNELYNSDNDSNYHPDDASVPPERLNRTIDTNAPCDAPDDIPIPLVDQEADFQPNEPQGAPGAPGAQTAPDGMPMT